MWSLVTTVPNAEPRVRERLVRHGYAHHIFRHVETFLRNGRKVTEPVITFPRYVFAPLVKVWEITERVGDVQGPVCFDGQACLLPKGLVESMVASCVAPDVLPIDDRGRLDLFLPGERVIVVGRGAFSNEVGIYVKSLGCGRSQVEFGMFKRRTVVELDDSTIHSVKVKTVEKRKRTRYGGVKKHLVEVVHNDEVYRKRCARI